uniref:Uncharacterized protein n=1 Tax=Rhizophora mucronata TaxID=61149 RepID=A0A2P2KVL2_RHIMU
MITNYTDQFLYRPAWFFFEEDVLLETIFHVVRKCFYFPFKNSTSILFPSSFT